MIQLKLTCECGASVDAKVYYSKSKWGTVRVSASLPSGWVVDGNGAVCPRHHLLGEDPRDSWEAHDLREAYNTVEEHEQKQERCRDCPDANRDYVQRGY